MTQHSLSLPTLALATSTLPDALPDEGTCWQAVQRRDRAYNGRFWFSVRTTGVYCLPSCAARPALRRNVAFHASPDAAEAAGFRAAFIVATLFAAIAAILSAALLRNDSPNERKESWASPSSTSK